MRGASSHLGQRAPADSQDTTPQIPQSTPNQTSAHGGDYAAFVWQQLNDIQGRLGKLDQAAQTQAAAADKIDQRLTDLHNKIHSINIKLAAAAAIFAVAVTAGGWLFKEAWDVVKPIVVQKLTATNGR